MFDPNTLEFGKRTTHNATININQQWIYCHFRLDGLQAEFVCHTFDWLLSVSVANFIWRMLYFSRFAPFASGTQSIRSCVFVCLSLSVGVGWSLSPSMYMYNLFVAYSPYVDNHEIKYRISKIHSTHGKNGEKKINSYTTHDVPSLDRKFIMIP